MDSVPTSVQVIWWITLIATVFVIVPVVVGRLHRLLRAAQQIERYAARTLDAGVDLAGNTANIAALDQTIETATAIVATAQDIEEHTGTIARVLADRAEAVNQS